MTYEETTAYLFGQMPMFEKQGASGYKEGLENTRELDYHFGHPHHNFRTIHVAGTNGKGSCSHMLAALLQQCGYKTGLYTSPHLVDFRERIRINGSPVSKEYVVDFVEKERKFFEPLHPSFFEVTTAMAFKYFSDMQVDIAVIEVGLGGRLDCTNIITPVLSVITNISFDHTQFLGNTLEKIASEKAGIIKEYVPVVVGETTPETRPVFEEKAAKMNAPIAFAEDKPAFNKAEQQSSGMCFASDNTGTLTCDLSGNYQLKNINTVLTAVEQLGKLGYLGKINKQDTATYPAELKEAIANVCKLTGLKGRWQTIKDTPHVVCDTGHNAAGWQYLSQQLKAVKCTQMHIIFGMVEDKDVNSVLKLLPKNALYYFVKPNNKRGMDENEIRLKAEDHGIHGISYLSLTEAYKAAMHNAGQNDFVFIGGSNYLVADFLENCI
jgi:dihydrofolate synthase/folylpolyglutamate synthase